MGRIEWTKDQKKIIAMRDCNILVSAAAGSGKTAVLVERIFERIMDKEDPVDIDRFVIVTFTKAAAAQMKDRLRERIEEAIEKEPDNLHLQRQAGLVSSAHISTVHSFCGFVIQNYFHRIGLDPAYRQGTQSELSLLRTETLEEILEEEYTEQAPDFLELAGMNMFNRSDARMLDMIQEIYDKAVSEPFPYEWLERMEHFLSVDKVEDWESSEFCRVLLADCKCLAVGMEEEKEKLLGICRQPAGPYYYEKQLEELGEICEQLKQAVTYEDFYRIFSDMTFSRMTSKRDETVEDSLKQAVQEGRKRCKEALEEMRDGYFFQRIEEHIQDLQAMGGKLKTLLRLTRRFLMEFTEKKRERGIVDFNDLEQLALSILLVRDEEKNEYVRSEAARELAGQFAEIMIDEYQDSNRVQDTLLKSVSRDGLSGYSPNIFMVGDVKQSIYRFRNACPELFGEKLFTYEDKEGAACRRVDLHENFRSREMILEGTNRVFETIMHKDLGGVEYDKKAALFPGREFEPTKERAGEKIDTYVILEKEDAELEGKLIAAKIRELTGENPLHVWEDGGYRPVTYRDIVILTRSVKNVGQSYFDALTEAGIPTVMEHSQGFFETREIQLMTAMLKVLDNPRQDMPLASVLCGPMFGMSEDELARIRAKNRQGLLYESLLAYEDEDEVKAKIEKFSHVLNRLREKISYATVAELIQDVYEETGIYEKIRMMKEGVQRTANMDSLMELAREFDKTTYHGLYQFVRYINRIQEQKEEMGEVNIAGEEENVVRIMTIHKSKGLEFPVVIVAGMGRKLGSANRSFLTIFPKMGISSKIIDNETKTAKDTIYRKVLQRQNDLADLGEDMRVLYVAMTRAKEKLVLVGCAKEISASGMNYMGRSHLSSLMDMVLPAALTESTYFNVISVSLEELEKEAMAELEMEEIDLNLLYNFDTSVIYDKMVREGMDFSGKFSEEETEPLPVKVSVSDLKMKSMEELEAEDFTILSHEEEEGEMPVPAFMKKEEEENSAKRGAAYGTIWHQVMASIDFSKTETKEEIAKELSQLIAAGRLRQEERDVIKEDKLLTFFDSSLGRKMKFAAGKGNLHREQPFVIGKPACEVFPDRNETETVLVQGIIDGYFEEEEGIVLVDYKTDALKPGEEKKLADRYRTQMKLYKEALETMTGCRVKECILYSFSLQKEILCLC
ncbi:MAG: helicase-exonuclease AddAB subunit AddA [Lachnospiraceae bacterium]|nr:helicase-exonuclease AddAB subunit AddA [Lachnospiraceae bacterium]